LIAIVPERGKREASLNYFKEVLSFTYLFYCNIESSRSCPHDGCYGHYGHLLCTHCQGIGSV